MTAPAPAASPSPRPPKLLNSPLDILRQTRGQTVSVELTNGETINGSVMRTDRAMNVVLKSVIRTSADGGRFWRCREMFIRGSSIKNIRMDAKALRPPRHTTDSSKKFKGAAKRHEARKAHEAPAKAKNRNA